MSNQEALESLVTKTSTKSSMSEADTKNVKLDYPTGEPAVVLDDLGCGFCYYETGRVAVCVSKVDSLQRRYYFYENNRHKHLLCSLDEHVVGSAGRLDGIKLVLTRDGGIMSNAKNDIIKTWKWDPRAQNAGSPPTEPITLQLNDFMTFKFIDRKNVSVKFVNSGVSIEFHCGEKLKREDTYLEHSQRIKIGPRRGKLDVNTKQPTLVQRQKGIELASMEKRSKQHPRSNDLGHPSIKEVVASLERKFDTYEGCQVTPYCTGPWLQEAHKKTIEELPVLPKTGFEVGKEPTLYGMDMQPHTTTHLLSELQDKDGQWLTSLAIRDRLEKANPVLPRTAVLCNASGRYSVDIQVPGGMAKAEGKRLDRIPASRLDAFLEEECTSDQLVIVACLRADDRFSRQAEKVLEQVNELISEPKRDWSEYAFPQSLVTGIINGKFKIVKIELAESREISIRYRIHATPTFLMFYETNLVSATSFGGQALRIAPTTKNVNLTHHMDQPPQTLLLQTTAKQQVLNEKILRKEHFSWDLAISAEQALQRISKQSKSAPVNGVLPSYNLILMADDICDTDLKTMERYIRTLDGKKTSQECIVGLILTKIDLPFANTICELCRVAQGRRISSAIDREDGVCSHCGLIPKKLVEESTAGLSTIAHAYIYKHIRAPTLHRLAEQWNNQVLKKKMEQINRTSEIELYKGLTIETLFREMDQFLQLARRGQFLSKNSIPNMALSAPETTIRNTPLLSKPPHSA